MENCPLCDVVEVGVENCGKCPLGMTFGNKIVARVMFEKVLKF